MNDKSFSLALRLLTLVEQFKGDQPVRVEIGRGGLAKLFGEIGFRRGAEVGVWKGEFAEALCRSNPHLVELLCVDPWAPQSDYFEQKNNADVLHRAYVEAHARLDPFKVCRFLRMTSRDAADNVPDGSLDFVYVDGNHRYENVMQDLEAWAPKVRAGGIVAGHDFITKPKKHITVEQAVREFTTTHHIRPWFVLADSKDVHPSYCWMVAQ